MTDYAAMLADLDAGALSPAGFSHAHHVGVTVQALSEGDFYDAHARIARGLQRLTHTAGVPEKFNATLTFAFVTHIAQRWTTGQTPAAFLLANPDLLSTDPTAGLYTPVQLASPLARRLPILPAA